MLNRLSYTLKMVIVHSPGPAQRLTAVPVRVSGAPASLCTLTVYREGAVVSGCKYGDTVKLQLTVSGILYVQEISITEKKGEIIYIGR